MKPREPTIDAGYVDAHIPRPDFKKVIFCQT